MRAARISGADPTPLGAPDDWDEAQQGHCGGLFVRREMMNGVPAMRSAWEVESVEAARLFAGAPMTLAVGGICHPVVQLAVGDLPADFEPTVMARRYATGVDKWVVRVDMLFPKGDGRHGFCNVPVETTTGAAVAIAIDRIEAMARREGWIE
jgi:hypothetical protein